MRSRFLRTALALAAAALCASLIGCARSDTSAITSDSTATLPPPGAMAGDLTDERIAAIVVVYNNEEIEHARLAQEKATDPQVKQFAQQMITDHDAVNRQANELATRLNLTTEDSDVSRKLATDGNAFRESARTQTGADFDRAYIANEVQLHQQVLDQIDQALIPNADNAELKQLLENTRPAVAAHLEHAKQIQTALGAGGATGAASGTR